MSQPDVEYIVDTPDETVRFARSKRGHGTDMDITPMIDVTFLLLIFFLVAARLSDEAFVELPTAKNGTAVSQESSVIVTLTPGTGDSANVYMGDGADEATRIDSGSLEDQQRELESYIQDGLTVQSKSQLLIKAEVGVRHRDVARVARAAGGASASVMYLAVLEER